MFFLASALAAEPVETFALEPLIVEVIPTPQEPASPISPVFAPSPIPGFGSLGEGPARAQEIEAAWAPVRIWEDTPGEEAVVTYLLEALPAQIHTLEERLWAQATTFEGASAALTLSGEMRLELAQLLYDAPPPPVPPEECANPVDITPTLTPLIEGGVARLEASVALAREHGRWSVWQDRAVALLYERDPARWPGGASEVRGQPGIDVPRAGPISASAP